MSEKEKSIIDLAKEHVVDNTAMKSPDHFVAEVKDNRSEPVLAEGGLDELASKLLSKAREKAKTIEVKLPSRGLPYPEYGKDYVRIKPFGFQEERAIQSISNMDTGAAAIDLLFSNCVDGPPHAQYTLPDKEYILFKLREISFGDTYPVDMNCISCGKSNKGLKLKISNLPVNYLESWEARIKVKLPDSELTIAHSTPRSKDEMNLTDTFENLSTFIISVDGYEDSFVIRKVISELSARDLQIIRQSVFDTSYGLDKLVFFNCIHCDQENSTILPLNQHFFTASLDQDAP